MPRQDQGEPYSRISLEEAKDMMENQNALVIDVRQKDEWDSGHVSGAIHMPVDDIISRVDELPTDRNLLFICAMGVRSGLACEMATAMGVDANRVYNIEDGTPAWIAKSYPTESRKNPIPPFDKNLPLCHLPAKKVYAV